MLPGQSSDARLNPYSSPAAAGGYFAEEVAGVGTWRDGKQVVMHRRAQLPSFCIKTGQPAVRYVPFKLRWYYPIDWSTRKLPIQLPFCEVAFRGFRRKRLIGLFILIFAVFFMIGSQLLLMINPPRGMFTLITICSFAAGAVLRASPLKFIRVRGEYLWFSGAGSDFLAKLPDWTFGH